MKTNRKVFERYLTPTEERQLFRFVRQFGSVLARRDFLWMGLLRRTGIRVGTLAGLTVRDAEQAVIDGRLTLRDEICKKGNGYTVSLTRQATQDLKGLLKIRREMGHSRDLDAPLVMSRNHQAMSVRSYQARVAQWCQMAGLHSGISPHWFRHTLAKRVMANSSSPDPRGHTAAILGQRDINSTVIYTLPDREDVLRSLEEAM